MTHGPFGSGGGGAAAALSGGGGAPRESICVQSLDGQLAVFEQERFAFRRPLDGCLLPGPLAYVPRTDSLVTCTSEMLLDSYRYAALASAWGATDGAPHQARARAGRGGPGDDATTPPPPRSLAQGLAASAALSSAAASRAGAVGLEGAAGSAVPKPAAGSGPRPDWRCNVGEGLVRGGGGGEWRGGKLVLQVPFACS